MSVLLTAVLALSSPAPLQVTPQVLYSPARNILDQKITLRGWGSGTGSETDETYYEGAHSIRVSTRNYFQGAQLTYDTPIDLSSRFADRNNLLKIVVKAAGTDATTGGGASGSGESGRGAPIGGSGRPGMAGSGMGSMGGRPGSGGPGMSGSGSGGRAPGSSGGGQGRPGSAGPGGVGMPGGMGTPGGSGMGGSGASTAPAPLTTVRVIVSTTDGKKSEAYMPIPTTSNTERGWRTVAIPLQAINGFERTNKIVKDITFSGDVTTTFFVGDVRVVDDATTIRGEIYNARRSYNLALGDRLTLTGNGQGGASVLEYVWDFDASDGLQEDAVGQTVVHQFRNAGLDNKSRKFTVTLTIRDKYGLKPSATATTEVVVNP